jgi:hypothetical protein
VLQKISFALSLSQFIVKLFLVHTNTNTVEEIVCEMQDTGYRKLTSGGVLTPSEV